MAPDHVLVPLDGSPVADDYDPSDYLVSATIEPRKPA